MDYTYEDISKMIDHSLLNPILTAEKLENGCQLALDYNVASICIYAIPPEAMCRNSARPARLSVSPTAIKLAEAKQALNDGGQELDMVVNISKVIKSKSDIR